MPSVFEESDSPILIVVLTTRRVIDANPAAVRFSGYSRAEFKTRVLDDFHPPDDVKRLLERCMGYQEDRRSDPYSVGPVTFTKKDGAQVQVHAVCHRVQDGDDAHLYVQLLLNKAGSPLRDLHGSRQSPPFRP